MNKYQRIIKPCNPDYNKAGIPVDVYSVLMAFNVICPARQHAIKKLLCAGLRNKGSEMQDLQEAAISIQRAIEIQELKGVNNGRNESDSPTKTPQNETTATH